MAAELEIRTIPGEGDLSDALAVRRQVFIEEQAVPEADDLDGREAEAEHVIGYLGGMPVATARVRYLPDKTAKIERVAVLSTERGQNLGAQIMSAIEEQARRHGSQQAVLEAQTHALGFYEKLGYEAEGAEFMDAGIPHRKMHRDL